MIKLLINHPQAYSQGPKNSTGHTKPESPIYVNQIPNPDYENVPSLDEEDEKRN